MAVGRLVYSQTSSGIKKMVIMYLDADVYTHITVLIFLQTVKIAKNTFKEERRDRQQLCRLKRD